MNIVGIDVSKNTLVGVRIDRNITVKESYCIPNTIEEIEKFVVSLCARYTHLVVASEATSEYHRILALSCLEHNIPFRLLNPITTKQFTRATVRKRKTDISDAFVIAKLAFQKEGIYVTKSMFTTNKAVVRTGVKLRRMDQGVKRMLKRFADLCPDREMLNGSLSELNAQLQETIGVFEKESAREVDGEMRKLLCSLPGIGSSLSVRILEEIGTIDRFSNGKALVAFSGLDPKVKQSGVSLHQNTHLTKRGSPYLRQALFIAASIARQHDKELKAYYEKKRKEGKRYKEATIAVARKLTYRIYAVWKRNTPYIKN